MTDDSHVKNLFVQSADCEVLMDEGRAINADKFTNLLIEQHYYKCDTFLENTFFKNRIIFNTWLKKASMYFNVDEMIDVEILMVATFSLRLIITIPWY